MEISYRKGKALSILLFAMDIMPMMLWGLLSLDLSRFIAVLFVYGCVPIMILGAILHWIYQKRLLWPIQVTFLSRLLRCIELLPALLSCGFIALLLESVL